MKALTRNIKARLYRGTINKVYLCISFLISRLGHFKEVITNISQNIKNNPLARKTCRVLLCRIYKHYISIVQLPVTLSNTITHKPPIIGVIN